MKTSFLGNKRVKAVLISGAVLASAFLSLALGEEEEVEVVSEQTVTSRLNNPLPADSPKAVWETFVSAGRPGDMKTVLSLLREGPAHAGLDLVLSLPPDEDPE